MWNKGTELWQARLILFGTIAIPAHAHTFTFAAQHNHHIRWDERFEHPVRTWASASHRAFTLQATGVAMANAT
jgi:hypothetical protein